MGSIPGSGRVRHDSSFQEEGMAIHSSILAWRIPQTEGSGGLQCMGSQSWTRLSNTFFTFLPFTTFSCRKSFYSPGGSDGKASAYNADPRSIPGSGRSPGEGNGKPLQYSCLENPTDRETCQAIVHGVAKSQT